MEFRAEVYSKAGFLASLELFFGSELAKTTESCVKIPAWNIVFMQG
jgi:hypothetical protein